MEKILIAGCGDIALRVARELRGRYRMFGLVRRPERAAELRAAGIVPLQTDLDNRRSLQRIAGLADSVLHFAPPAAGSMQSSGEPAGVLLAGAADRGERDPRTCNLLAALAQGTLPKRFVYISTSGVYGDCGGERVDEARAPNPQTLRARRRLDAERQIRAWAKRNGVSASILRVPGIYAAERLPLERLRAGTPAIVAEEDSYTNHIHADDLARIVIAALRHAQPSRVYHASDDSNLKMGDYFDAVADAHNLSRPPRQLRAQVRQAVSPALWSFMNESRQLENHRMKRELKVVLRYPTVADALRGMLK